MYQKAWIDVMSQWDRHHGANAQFVIEASEDIYLDEDKRTPVFNMFVEAPHPDELFVIDIIRGGLTNGDPRL